MSALIVWITKTVARWWFGGNTDRASGVVAWGFTLVTVIATGLLVHSFDSAQHRAEIAEIRTANATALEEQALQTLRAERAERDALTSRDNAYAQVARQREVASVESADLSARLLAALDRLRELGGGTPAAASWGVPAADPSVDGCADLRTARDRAIAAVELLQSAGDQIARDGQYGVDVATAAHLDALAREGR